MTRRSASLYFKKTQNIMITFEGRKRSLLPLSIASGDSLGLTWVKCTWAIVAIWFNHLMQYHSLLIKWPVSLLATITVQSTNQLLYFHPGVTHRQDDVFTVTGNYQWYLASCSCVPHEAIRFLYLTHHLPFAQGLWTRVDLFFVDRQKNAATEK